MLAIIGAVIGIAVIAILVAALAGNHLYSSGGTSLTGLTAMHDMLPKDKQEAIEIVIEQKAGKQFQEQANADAGGAKDDPGKRMVP